MLARLALALAFLALARPAEAGLSVCNKTSGAVRVALGRYDGRGWVSEGWWDVPAGQCRIVIALPLNARYYYLYAQAGDGFFWPGGRGFCVDPERDFRVRGRAGCAAAGLSRKGFLEIDTGNKLNYTQTLSG